MLKINLYRNNNAESTFYGKVYGRVENAEPIDVTALAKHMAEHNTPYSQGVIKGILTDMVSCIKELMLMGQPVKLADLAIFKATVQSKPANDAKSFDLGKHIVKVKLCAQATGEMKQKQLTEEGLLGFTSLAEEIRAGRAQLKKKDQNQEP
ncbi:MAG: DNA-binding protein [Prevotella sp.]|nr:DNA-binding protein [Prevotella sp.]